jgi:organic hydroperoxide reductase OsmC/OhrA
LEAKGDSWTIKEIRLDVHATTTDLNPEKFHAAARRAKAACPISNALKVPIHLETHLHPAGVAVPA